MATDILERSWWESKGKKSPEDAIVLCVHALLLSRNFKCIHLSDKNFHNLSESHDHHVISDADNPALPHEWNTSDVYTLQYENKMSRMKVLVKGLRMGEDAFILNVAVPGEADIEHLTISPAHYINTAKMTSTVSTYKDLTTLVKLLEEKLVNKISPKNITGKQSSDSSDSVTNKRSGQLQEGYKPIRSDPLLASPRQPILQRPPEMPSYQGDPRELDPFAVGDRDLDPLGRGGGGLLMDPIRSGGRPVLRNPSVPPGARFDPYGPIPLVGPRPHYPRGPGPYGPTGNPNPDHLPPPGWPSSSDMYM